MTALDQFDRLESLGQWRKGHDNDAREVVVKFGKSTLVIEAEPDVPLAHWSLAALQKVEETPDYVSFRVDRDSDEYLTIDDPIMREAIDIVMANHLATGTPVPRRRSFVWAGWTLLLLGGLTALVFFGLNQVVYTLISPEQADRIAVEMVPRIEERTGPACRNEPGQRALNVIAARLSVDRPVNIRVIDLGDRHVLDLPGGTVILNRATVEAARSEAELAGWAALGLSEPNPEIALQGLFDEGVSLDALTFLANGTVSGTAYERAVNRLLINGSSIGMPSPDRLSSLLEKAEIPASPLSAALRRENLVLQITGSQGPEKPVLTDDQWVALQQICD